MTYSNAIESILLCEVLYIRFWSINYCFFDYDADSFSFIKAI